MKKIILAQPIINLKESSKYIKKVLKNNFPNEGEQTKLFEKKICNFLKVKHAVCVTSGTTAIFLALKACGIKIGDEVIIPNITFPATANAVMMSGGKPVLVDVNPKTLLIDQASLIKKINSRTKFVIPVHVSGRGSNIREVLSICKKNSIKVVEDSAEAFGSKIKNKNLGTFGIAGCYSFAPNKIITTGQGGVVVSNDKKIYKKLVRLKDQGRVGPTTGGEDNYVSVGYNFKFSNIQSALGVSQMNSIKSREKKLIKIHKYYLNNLNQNKSFKILNFNLKNGELPLWTDVFCKNRNKLFNYLKSKKIICRYFWKPLNTCKPYKKSFRDLNSSKNLQKKLMWLPSSLDMSIAQQEKVCKYINKFLQNK